ncbi:hypothetical protein CAEBREN_32524 [Caenorhabditis brenneri]|uniref:Uncharacterized protein n=1 Tax=Caenorhabditis brenneri TaxID=135651 RepID=G0N9N9_CAEBE|nr:hypothetical protein CAEBREN_32524 [Caenorhabditis brenneri]
MSHRFASEYSNCSSSRIGECCSDATPGLGFPDPKPDPISFASAPILSHNDVKEKREKMEAMRQRQVNETVQDDEGWVTTGKPANNKKNKKKN